jgi:hypothetical protein
VSVFGALMHAHDKANRRVAAAARAASSPSSSARPAASELVNHQPKSSFNQRIIWPLQLSEDIVEGCRFFKQDLPLSQY